VCQNHAKRLSRKGLSTNVTQPCCVTFRGEKKADSREEEKEGFIDIGGVAKNSNEGKMMKSLKSKALTANGVRIYPFGIC
jgi:hypothetical protein